MPTSAQQELTCPAIALEAAIAARIIRSGKLPRLLFDWLATPEKHLACEASLVDQRVQQSLDEIFLPMLKDASTREKKAALYAASWLGATCRCTADSYRALSLEIGPRLLAASLLPMYRSLATGNLHEGFQQTRFRVSELLALLALCYEVGHDLVEVLDCNNRKNEAPNLILSREFDLDIVRVAEIVRQHGVGFDAADGTFSLEVEEELQRIDDRTRAKSMSEWAAPELLWRLSGELISQNSELVLPRAWIGTPVPWVSIGDHWQALSHLLSSPKASISVEIADSHSDLHCTTILAEAVSSETADAQTAADVLTGVTCSPAIGTSSSATSSPATSSSATSSPATVTSSAATTNSAKTGPISDASLPKVLIAEVRSHNDPVFVNVIRRQIGKCRADERSISLASIKVLPEGGSDRHDLLENGLMLWQQRLVNWLFDHPQVVEPCAFLTSDGELLLCLMDVEKNETTSLIRHGLVEVLSGKPMDEESSGALAKVNLPARYHVGIGSIRSPGAGFSAEQLIEPTMRCLSAASLQGKASIKSIEVF